jgi:hypothetical protein
MDHEAIDRLQALYFKTKLANVDAARLEEAARRISRNNNSARPMPENAHQVPDPSRMPRSWRWQETLQDWRHPW